MRFYFTIKDGRTYPDETGYDFTGLNEATVYANTLAGELFKEPDLRDSCIVVTDDQGLEVAKVPIVEAASASSGIDSRPQPNRGTSPKSSSDPG
jgi:hypothetical protein